MWRSCPAAPRGRGDAVPATPQRAVFKTRAWCCVLDAPSSVLEQLEMLLVALAPIADSCHHGSDHTIAARTSKLERLPHRSPYSRIDVVTEQRPSAVQASLRCLLVDLQAGGGLGSGQALDLPQHEHRAVDLWESVHGRLDCLGEFMVTGSLLRAGCGGHKHR